MAAGNDLKTSTDPASSSPHPQCLTKVSPLRELRLTAVVYKDGREEFISNPAEFPDTTDPKMRVAHIEEPMGESFANLR